MYSKEQQELLQEIKIEDGANAVIGVANAQMAAVFGTFGFVLIALIAVLHRIEPVIENSSVFWLIIGVAVLATLAAAVTMLIYKTKNIETIKENIRNGTKYF